MEKAWSVLQNKEFDENTDFVTVKGIATTPKPDRMGDIVVSTGMRSTGRVKLMLYHDHRKVVGNVTFAKATKAGIPFEAVIPKVKEPGVVQDRTNEAIHSLKYNLLDAVSIGFQPVPDKTERIPTGLKFNEWEWHELSLVGVGANPDAVIQQAKSLEGLSARPPVSRKAHSVKFSPRKPT